MPTPSTSASVASTRSDGDDRPRSIWLRKPIESSVRAATVSSENRLIRLRSRMRRPTATSIAGSPGLAVALVAALAFASAVTFLAGFAAAGLRILLPPLTSNRFLHVHENRLHDLRKCDQIFILVKIGRNGLARNVCDDEICERRRRPDPRGMR